MGLTGLRWVPCWPHEPCYLGSDWASQWKWQSSLTHYVITRAHFYQPLHFICMTKFPVVFWLITSHVMVFKNLDQTKCIHQMLLLAPGTLTIGNVNLQYPCSCTYYSGVVWHQICTFEILIDVYHMCKKSMSGYIGFGCDKDLFQMLKQQQTWKFHFSMHNCMLQLVNWCQHKLPHEVLAN